MAFAKALKHNTTSKELNLGYNHISSLGIEALVCPIFDTSSLNTTVDSNHTLFYFLMSHCIDDLVRRGCNVRVLFDIDNILQMNEVNALLGMQQKESPLYNSHHIIIPPAWTKGLPLASLTIKQLKSYT